MRNTLAARKKQTVFSKISRFMRKHRGLSGFLVIFTLFLLAAGIYLFQMRLPSFAQYYTDASAIYGLDNQYGDTQSHTPGTDFTLTVVANPPAAWMWGGSFPATAHINLEIYHDGPLTYQPTAFVCGSAGSCTTGPAFPGNGPYFVADDRRCVNLTSASIHASQITLMTIGYRMGSGGSATYGGREGSFEVRAHGDWEPGGCGNSNDWQNCYFVSQSQCANNSRAGFPLGAYGGGPLSAQDPDPSPTPDQPAPGGPQGPNEGPTGPGSGKTPGTSPNRVTGGGGGASATTQGDDSSPLPSSVKQGDQDQTVIEPSPFFDGKLFAAGSNASDSTKAVSVGGFKLGLGWVYLGGLAAVLALGGFVARKSSVVRSVIARFRTKS